MLVKEIMSRQVVTVSPNDTLQQALTRAMSHRIRHLPVVDEGRLVGIVSDRDLRDARPSSLLPAETSLGPSLLDQSPVSRIMRTSVITAHPLDPIDEAARLLYEHRIGCLPVLQAQQLVGIVTETDVLRRLVELTGATRPGSHLEVEVPDQPGMLAAIAEIIKRHNVNISSILTMPGPCPNCLVLALRLQVVDLRPIIGGIKALGYTVRWPVEPE